MPPVSSRTTSRSVPCDPLALQRAGVDQRLARPAPARRFANSPSPLRRPSRPCSGRGLSGSVVSHFGPPTAQSSTASDWRHASSTSSVSAAPCSSIEAPPIRCSVDLEVAEGIEHRRRRGRDLGADAVAGKEATIRSGIGPARRDVEADVVEDERIILERSRTASANGRRRSSGSWARCGPMVTVVVKSYGSVGLARACPRSQQRTSVESGAAQALLSLLGRGEVPHHLACPGSARRTRAASRRRRSPRRARRRCPRRRTAATSRPPGRRAACRRGEEPVVVEDPVEGRRREDHASTGSVQPRAPPRSATR